MEGRSPLAAKNLPLAAILRMAIEILELENYCGTKIDECGQREWRQATSG
jgi:hypothetical protein